MTLQPATAMRIAPAQFESGGGSCGGGCGGGSGICVGGRATVTSEAAASMVVLAALERAMAVAETLGYTRADLAKSLGITLQAVHNWFKSRQLYVPPARIAQLLVCDDVLPRPARIAFFNALAVSGGLVVCEPASAIAGSVAGDDQDAPLYVRMLSLVAVVGRLSSLMEAAAGEKSQEGRSISRVEARQLRDQARLLTERTAQMAVVFDAMAGGKGMGVK